METPTEKQSGTAYSTKKCPECYEHVPLNAEICPACKARIGKVGPHGMAERPTNWKAYVLCAILWIIFVVYIKWAFL